MSLNLTEYYSSRNENCLGSFTLVLIGDFGTGKSSIMERIADNRFMGEHQSTIGVDLRMTIVRVDRGNVKFRLWDTAGQERFRALISTYYKDADAILVVSDCTDTKSLNNLYNVWYRELVNSSYFNDKVLLYVAVNKWDLRRRLSRGTEHQHDLKARMMKSIAPMDDHCKRIFYVSAKNAEGVKDMMKDISNDILDKRAELTEADQLRRRNSKVLIVDENPREGFSCSDLCTTM